MLKTISLSLLLIAVIFSCKNTKTESSETETININIPPADNSKADFITDAQYVFLDSEVPIGSISRLLVVKNKFIIHDALTHQVHCFNFKGAHLFSIKHQGRGKGEYAKITDIAINEDNQQIAILDTRSQRVLLYSLANGEFQNFFPLEFRPTQLAYSNNYYYFNNPFSFNYPDSNTFHYTIIKTTNKGKVQDKFIPTDKRLASLRSIPNKAFYYGEELLFIDRYSHQIKKIASSNIKNRFTLNFPSSERFHQALNKVISNKSHEAFDQENIAYGINQIANTTSHVSFSYTKNNRQHYVIFNKQTRDVLYHKSLTYKFTEQLIARNIPLFHFPQSTYNNQFISVIQPTLIKKYIVPQNPHLKKMTDKQLLQKFLSVSINDNPVIAFYNFSFE
ncbi:6-bladed beta-propeller [Puteibacter caeruleilacunae]|nr:6-bladed beta-propeller [Puteibacter caeruleilacunae]